MHTQICNYIVIKELVIEIFAMAEQNNSLHQQIAAMRQSFFDEGLLDKYYEQLEELQSSFNPNFVEDVITMFFRDSTRLLATIDESLDRTPVDFLRLDRMLHQLKGSSASIGGVKVHTKVNETREHLKERNIEGAKASFQDLKEEHKILKEKLEPYFQMVRQAGPVQDASQAGPVEATEPSK